MGLVVDASGSQLEPTPPEAMRWEFFLRHGVKPVCTFVRRREGERWGPARIVVSYRGAEPELPPDPVVPWDPVLEDWLLDHGIPARDQANEVTRLGHALEIRLGATERRYGTGLFTAVLLRCLYDHDCALYVPLERKLGAIRSYEPDPSDARTEVGAELGRIMQSCEQILAALGYPAKVAGEIFASALAYYLRDRFDL